MDLIKGKSRLDIRGGFFVFNCELVGMNDISLLS
jgi:hypothetical protein